MIHFLIGTRAQIFKMAPVMLECERRGLKWRWIYAGEHKDTFAETIDLFGLPNPDYTIVKWDNEANTMGKMYYWFGCMVAAMPKSKKILAGHVGKKHIILTHGDTPTTPFGGVMGKLTRTNVMHVESGLRSFNIFSPFPEEISRLITFRLSNYYAAPGDWAYNNLKKYKGVKVNTGMNTQIDALRIGLANADKAKLVIPKKKYIVASVHRYENVFKKERFNKILTEIEKMAKDYTVLMPQHPVTKKQLVKFGYDKRLEKNKNIKLLPRLEYLDFLKAIKHAEFVATDGGGNQEELFHLGKPTLILRDTTERQEGIGTTAIVSKLDSKVIRNFVKNYKKYEHPPTKDKHSPTSVIVDTVEKFGK